jgi:periplasmic protein TonB
MSPAPRSRRTLVHVGGALVAVVLIALFVAFVHSMLAAKTNKKGRQVQVVQIIRPPPPPPPDQPPPPPPEKTEEALPKDEPEPTPDQQQAPSEQLGVDAEGTAGGDAFGLAARRGGSDLIGSGGAAFAWYTGKLKDEVLDRLSNDKGISSKKFSVSVRVWIEPDGRIKEIKLTTSTGNADLDKKIELVMDSLKRLSEAPPLEMPQPISLKIVSRS